MNVTKQLIKSTLAEKSTQNTERRQLIQTRRGLMKRKSGHA
jgi:hypothetical protein